MRRIHNPDIKSPTSSNEINKQTNKIKQNKAKKVDKFKQTHPAGNAAASSKRTLSAVPLTSAAPHAAPPASNCTRVPEGETNHAERPSRPPLCLTARPAVKLRAATVKSAVTRTGMRTWADVSAHEARAASANVQSTLLRSNKHEKRNRLSSVENTRIEQRILLVARLSPTPFRLASGESTCRRQTTSDCKSFQHLDSDNHLCTNVIFRTTINANKDFEISEQ